MNGDQILDTRFLFCRGTTFFGWALADPAWGYEAAQVDGLLRRVAGELDAGRPAGPLIENATFRRRGRSPRYDIDAVDWFLGQLLLRPGPSEPAGIDADPWRGLAVAQLTQGGGGFLQACESAWRDFGQQQGTRLRWVKATPGLFRSARYELRTAEQQTIASRVEGHRTVEAGGRSFTWKKTPIPTGSTAGSWPSGIAELATPQLAGRRGALRRGNEEQPGAQAASSLGGGRVRR